MFKPHEYTADIPFFIYLTNWGFMSVFFYFTMLAFHHIRQGTSHLLRSDSATDYAPIENFDQRYLPFSSFFYHLGLTLQPFVVLGYWALVFPAEGSCNASCLFLHGFLCVLMYMELMLTKLLFDKKLVWKVVAVPLSWLVLQTVRPTHMCERRGRRCEQKAPTCVCAQRGAGRAARSEQRIRSSVFPQQATRFTSDMRHSHTMRRSHNLRP